MRRVSGWKPATITLMLAVIPLSGCKEQRKAPALGVAEQTIRVGEPVVIEARSPTKSLAVVFEDDGETGYFYALDTTRTDQPMVDALHIYDVAGVTDRDKPSVVQIRWSGDGLKAALLINDYPHAVFDFESRRGYCRTNFPPPDRRWTQHSHAWDDAAMEHFR